MPCKRNVKADLTYLTTMVQCLLNADEGQWASDRGQQVPPDPTADKPLTAPAHQQGSGSHSDTATSCIEHAACIAVLTKAFDWRKPKGAEFSLTLGVQLFS